MKKIILVLLVLSLALTLVSCSSVPSAEEMLADFIDCYGVGGIIYSPNASEGEDGYITDELFLKIYISDGKIPENYAIFLNSHADYGSECAVFVCSGELSVDAAVDMARERISLFPDRRDEAFIIQSGKVVFYSTMQDRARAEDIWRKIIRAYT